jgi:hypothetical protein
VIRASAGGWDNITTGSANPTNGCHPDLPMWQVSSKFCDGQSGRGFDRDADNAAVVSGFLVDLLWCVPPSSHDECFIGKAV